MCLFIHEMAVVRGRGIFIDFTNIRGLDANFASVEHHLSNSVPHLLLLSETQMAKDSSSNFNISNYTLFRNFRLKGGVCAYVNINTPVTRLENLESPNFDVIWLKIFLPSTTIILCFCYCSPNRTDFPSFFEYLTTSHETVTTSHPNSEILYLGDFNVHNTEWLGSSHTDIGGEEAETFSILNDLDQLINEPTHIPDRPYQFLNTLDLCFTTSSHLYNYTSFPPIGNSDHNLLSLNFNTVPPTNSPCPTRTFWHFNRADWGALRRFYTNYTWSDCFLSGDASTSAEKVGAVIVDGMNRFIPSSSKSFSPQNPWFDRTCSRAIQARDSAYRGWKNSPSPITLANFHSARNRCRDTLRRAKHAFTKRKCANLTDSPTEKSFWPLAKNISNNFCKSVFPPLIRPDNTVANTPSEKANLFGLLFSSNSTLDDSGAPPPTPSPLRCPMSLPVITHDQVHGILRSMNVKKAGGPDGIPPRVLRECASALAPILVQLYSLCLNTNTFPQCWKRAYVQPVPKKGSRSDPSNYRPIALTCILSKVFETLLNSHFLDHLESHSLLSDHQYGFRRSRSTGDILSYLTDLWLSTLKNYGETWVVALDISKAFDRVWHASLLSKLPSFGFPPPLCLLISSFLSNRSISAVVDGATSSSFPINSGVPQGSVLSPTLFLLFINDLLSISSNPIHSYADDSTLHSSTCFKSAPSTASRIASRLNLSDSILADLDGISRWGGLNLVKFNSLKTQLLQISLSKTPSHFPIVFEGSPVSPVDNINILGLNINNKMSWKPHITMVARAASKKLGILFRLREFFSSSQLLQIYKGLIRPCMEYCSHIWGGSGFTRLLDRVESKAKRLINSSNLSDSLDPLSLRRDVGALSLFYRYHGGRCSRELNTRVPPPLRRPRSTRGSMSAHEFCVDIANPRLARCGASFFPATSVLWNSLPSSVFPAEFNLPYFKSRVCAHLRSVC